MVCLFCHVVVWEHEPDMNSADMHALHLRILTFAHFRLLDYQLWTTLLDNSTLG